MNIYKLRREKLSKSFQNNTCIIIFSGKEIMKSEDEAYPFDVNRNFYYLTGLEKQDMALMIYKTKDVVKHYIFAQPYSEFIAKWYGGRMAFEDIKNASEIDEVKEYSELEDMFASIYNRNRKESEFTVALDLWNYTVNQDPSLGVEFANKIKAKYPSIKVCDVYPPLTKLRLLKDDYELLCIRQAIAITKSAQDSMMVAIKPGMNEMMMEATFDYALKAQMCNKSAFPIIAAAGKNATILHYRDNNQVMEDGSLFLADMGATFKNYCADITRTFPVNGKFTDRQKELYDVVLAAQKIVEENAKVGVKVRDLNNMVIEFYKGELPKHGLNKDVSEYYWHSVSHHLGLDTHDVDGGLGAVLQAGNVITNEPGLYVAEENIGIRIEDDLLITGTDCENLSKDLLKTTSDIETFMANH